MTNVPGSYQSNAQNDDGATGNLVQPPPAGAGGAVQVSQALGGNVFDTNGHDSTWRAVSGNKFAFSGTGFNLTAAGCLLTYTGASGAAFFATLSASVSVSPIATGGACGIAIAKNNDLVDTPMNDISDPLGATYEDLDPAGPDQQVSMTCQRRVVLNNGDTIRPVGAKGTADAQVSIRTLSLSLVAQ
jgi:hypothetical protein